MRAIRCISCCIALLLLLLLSACRRGGERILESGRPPGIVLECDHTSPVPPPDTSLVGNDGDTLRSGENLLIIPPNAIQGQPRRIIFATDPSRRVGASIQGGGNLVRTAELQISASRCPDNALDQADEWFIWRRGNQKLHTDTITGRRFSTRIDSTSGFMIAH